MSLIRNELSKRLISTVPSYTWHKRKLRQPLIPIFPIPPVSPATAICLRLANVEFVTVEVDLGTDVEFVQHATKVAHEAVSSNAGTIVEFNMSAERSGHTVRIIASENNQIIFDVTDLAVGEIIKL